MKVFHAEIKNGKRVVRGSKISFSDYVRATYKEGERIVLTIKKYRKARTDKQNLYYWGGVLDTIVQEIADTTGNDAETLHRTFKYMFLPKQRVMWRGIERKVVPSTTNLDVNEFSEYVNKVIAEAAQLGIVIQSPEEYYNS